MELLYTAHLPAGDGPFPTILALHGWGASAHDLIGLAPVLHGGRAIVLCPQGPLGFEIDPRSAPGYLGYGWFPLSQGRAPALAEIERAGDRLRAFLAAAMETYPIERRKIVALGFSQGGVMAYELVLRDPGRFAGLVALSSWLPAELADAIPVGAGLENLPALVMHGTHDPMIPVARGQESRERLVKRGLAVSYREYEMEHGIAPEALRDLVGWLEQKVLSPILLA
jgi:phospholipase/carboxylesterase